MAQAIQFPILNKSSRATCGVHDMQFPSVMRYAYACGNAYTRDEWTPNTLDYTRAMFL